MLFKLRQRHWILVVLLAGLAGALGVLWAVLWWEIDLDLARELLERVLNEMAGIHPLVLVAALAVLPLLGAPVSPMLIAAGMCYGVTGGILVCLAGLALNNTLGYVIASSWMHGPVERFALRRGWKIPVVPRSEVVRVVIFTRLAPGIPLPIQNYLLGLARVPYGPFMGVSLVAQMLPITAFVVTGGSLYSGSLGLILLGVCLLIVMLVGGQWALKYAVKRRSGRKVGENPAV